MSLDGRLSITQGNMKMGRGKHAPHSISLPPGRTCAPGVPCLQDCYARKSMYRLYHNVRTAWDHNLSIWQRTPGRFEQVVTGHVAQHRPHFFRWHIGGDIPDLLYLEMMARVAANVPNTKFLCFTKRHDFALVFADRLPQNLQLVLSMWPGFGDVDATFPRAWMQDGTEDRVPNNVLECPGCCEQCGMCWHLSQLGRDVYFHKH